MVVLFHIRHGQGELTCVFHVHVRKLFSRPGSHSRRSVGHQVGSFASKIPLANCCHYFFSAAFLAPFFFGAALGNAAFFAAATARTPAAIFFALATLRFARVSLLFATVIFVVFFPLRRAALLVVIFVRLGTS